jgi:hypothetical protein
VQRRLGQWAIALRQVQGRASKEDQLMRSYQFDDDTRARIAVVRQVAELPVSFYVVGQSPCPPGDLPSHVFFVTDMRCVYSITVMESPAGPQFYRHASFSLKEACQDKTPSPIAIFTVCHQLGFTGGEVSPGSDDDLEIVIGPSPGWQIGVQDDVVTIAECLSLEAIAALRKDQQPDA